MPWILHVFLKQGIIGEKTAKRTASFREKRVLQSENLRRAGIQMAEMNLAGLPANPQEDCQYIQLKKGLYKLQLSLTEYFCTILTIYHHGQKSSFQDSSHYHAQEWGETVL